MSEPHRGRSWPPPQAPQVVQKTLKYSERDEHLLRRLAGALVLQWDQLPDELQDLIIDQAAAVDDRDPAPHEVSDIERFVRAVRSIAIVKAPSTESV